MRNAEVINAISTKVAAAISAATGTDIPVITAEQIEAEQATVPFLAYLQALTPEAIEQLGGEHRGLYPTSPDDIREILIVNLATYAQYSARPVEWFAFRRPDGVTPEDWAARQEDEYLEQIPRAYWPDADDGATRTEAGVWAAEEALDAAFGAGVARATSPLLRTYAQRFADNTALHYLPADFIPEGSGEVADAERLLAAWAALRSDRDALIRDALAAGVTKMRIHQITGIGRATIDRIVAEPSS